MPRSNTPPSESVDASYGMWWAASRSDIDGVPGTLERHSDGRQILRLSGRLFDDEPPDEEMIIVGATGIGNVISLSGCRVQNYDILASAPREDWHVAESIHGAELRSEQEWHFREASFVVPGVTRWARWNLIQPKFSPAADNEFATLSISTTQRSEPLWTLDSVSVKLSTSVSTENDGEDFVGLRSRVDVVATSASARPASDLYRPAVYPLQVLVALATGMFTCATSGSVRCKANGSNEERYCNRMWHPHELKRDPGNALVGGFTLKDLTQMDGSLQRWANLLHSLGGVGDLYLAAIGERTGFAELRFQLVVQALEAYHRANFGGKTLTDDEWSPLLAKLRAVLGEGSDVPARHVVLRNKLSLLNSISLRSRLEELLGSIPNLADEIAPQGIAEFAAKVANTRNGLAHASKDSNAAIPRDERLFLATERLLALLEVLLLKDLGFGLDSKAVAEIVRRRVSWQPRLPI